MGGACSKVKVKIKKNLHIHGNDNRGNKQRWHKSILNQKPAWIICVKQSKININRRETTPPQRPSRAVPAPWVLSTTRKLRRYLRGSYLYPDHNSSIVLFLIFSFFYLPSLSIYSRSANISPVYSNRALSSLYQYKTRPLTADWLQVCFATRSDTAVKSVFLSACLRSGGRAGPPLLRLMYIAETLINPLFTNVAFRRDSVGDG